MIIFCLGIGFGISLTILLTSAKTEDLYDKIYNLEKELTNQKNRNKKLNMEAQKYFDCMIELHSRKDKAIKLIPEINFELNINGQRVFLKLIDTEMGKDLLEILEGKENDR